MYELNRDHVLAEAVLALASARDRLYENIRRAVSFWEFRPILVTVFGSATRKDMRTESDIDLFNALSDGTDELQAETRIAELAARMTAGTGNDARTLVYRESEVAPAPIFDSIVSDGHTVYGDSDTVADDAQRQIGR